jgi:hypothetical protein
MAMIYPHRLMAVLCVLGVLAGFAAPGGVLAAGGFFGGLPDLPLMPGLTEDRAAAVIFDKPQGRIVKLTATGRLTRAAVLDFYAGALPPLGWIPTRPGRFRRDGEILRLTIAGRAADGAGISVRFLLAPEGSAAK